MGNRTFIPHTQGFIRVLNLRAAQPGPHGLPVIFDTQGRMLEVLPPTVAPSGNLLVRSGTAAASVEVQRATIAADGKASFLDKAGKPIANVRPILKPQLNPALTVQKFTVGKNIIFLNGLGTVVPVEQGQSDGSVLEAQKPTNLPNGSLVYYALMVNDVYAYFLTGSKDNKILPTPATFPTTQAGLNQVTAFAAAQNPPKTFPDANALAIEVKTSWVLASSLPNNGAGYITMTASIPTYNTSSNTTWTPTANQTVLLAMVGLHVVGGAAGHPEMIWATFERTGNTPNAAYSYVNKNSVVTPIAQTTAGTWLFSGNGASGTFNVANMQYSAPNIVATTGPGTSGIISPSNTLRVNAWGANANAAPNPIDTSAAFSNSEIISINNSVRGMMPAGDVRNNYFTTGATWTINGFPPIGGFTGSITNGAEVGTSHMANTTLETYEQFPTSNCFACHGRGLNSVTPGTLSHIFSALKPLF